MNLLGATGGWLAHLLERYADHLRTASAKRRWLYAFGAGICGALAMAPVYALPLLVVAFTTLVLLIDGAKATQSPRRSAFITGWFFGFGYFLAGVYWMAFSFFVQADQFAWMAPFAVMGMPAFLGLFIGAATALYAAIRAGGWARIFLFATIWTVFEYARGHVLTGLPWNLAGQALAGNALTAQTAAWYGAYGLSLVTVFLAVSPAAIFAGSISARLSGVFVLLAGAALIVGAGAVRLAMPEPISDARVVLRIVQPNIPQKEKIDWSYWQRNFERQLDLSRGAIPPDARLFVLWPENGAPLLEESQQALETLDSDLPSDAVLLAGAVRRERDSGGVERYYNSIAVVEDSGNGRIVTGHYDKHHLVPYGEYLPFYDSMQKLGLAQLTPYGDAGFTPGSGPRTLTAGGQSFAPMVCYEAIFPGESYPSDARPDWLAMVTNDAWFGDTSGPRQHLDMARLRAIEAGLPLARSANTGISALFDGKGRLLARVPLYKAGKIEAPLPPPLTKTLYDRNGDWVFLLMIITCTLFGFYLRNE
ncbi:apolipoprotein N-acyltransferase [Hyphococcus formosus]|uniref:apolipoprotein N-acyltransferase n=1 Tax=Hyphococcus formosus TaxID=3143534 RepID=UPI00398AA812